MQQNSSGSNGLQSRWCSLLVEAQLLLVEDPPRQVGGNSSAAQY
jgi:hypothetical protein